jgi:Cu+-exporting ATPase
MLDKNNIQTLDEFEEEVGKGISATAKNNSIKVGSYEFVGYYDELTSEVKNRTTVHISANQVYKGCYIFNSEYRNGVAEIFEQLGADKDVVVLSGDNEGERERLEELLPKGTKLYFNQKPDDKLNFIKALQQKGKQVLMIGDGLNDAGALKQSNVGFVISENTNVFSPACDGILDATRFNKIGDFLNFSKKGIKIIKWAFLFSLFYNLIGLTFAVTGHLKPVVAAILMPLSSISIVIFTTIATQYAGKKLRTNINK